MRVEAHLCEACFRAPAPLLSPRDRPPRVELMRDRLGSVGTETSIGEKDSLRPPRSERVDRAPSKSMMLLRRKKQNSYCAMAYVLATIGTGVGVGYRFPTD